MTTKIARFQVEFVFQVGSQLQWLFLQKLQFLPLASRCLFFMEDPIIPNDRQSHWIIGHVNIGIIFYCIGNSQWGIYNTWSKSDRLFNTQSRVLQAYWFMMKNNEKATLNINMPYWTSWLSSANQNALHCFQCLRSGWSFALCTAWGSQQWRVTYNVQCLLDSPPVSVSTEPVYSDDRFATATRIHIN